MVSEESEGESGLVRMAMFRDLIKLCKVKKEWEN
jgi:hypothetical protein